MIYTATSSGKWLLLLHVYLSLMASGKGLQGLEEGGGWKLMLSRNLRNLPPLGEGENLLEVNISPSWL